MPDADPVQGVPFREWMARALHDPQKGYYARRVRTVGRQGDFSTSATVSDLLGRAIANWITQERSVCPSLRTVIEVGGGDGSLSASVRSALGWWQRRRWDWLMVETSAPLKEQQQARLGAGSAVWFNNMTDALHACKGAALIFHNELLDAFPVTLLQWDPNTGRWQEVWLQKDEGVWTERLEPFLPDGGDYGLLSAEYWRDQPLKQGQRLELGTAAREWMAGWAAQWKAGAMLTLDYGDVDSQVYHRQPRGTVRSYFMHQRLTGTQVYENMGRQDITADVNFADLARWGEAWGWRSEPLQTQREFLGQHVRNADVLAASDPAAAFLMAEQGAGTAFKALIQRPA